MYADDADNVPPLIAHRQLVRQEPVGNSLPVKEQLDDVQFRLPCAQYVFVIAAEMLRELRGE